MVLWSTPESAERGEFSVLALVETLAAVSVLMTTIYFTREHRFVLIPVLIAPLLLLRTQESTRSGLLLYQQFSVSFAYIISQTVEAKGPKFASYSIAALFIILFFPLITAAIKIRVTFTSIVTNFLGSVREIPRNWWRITLATDLHHPPEAIPGVELTKSQSPYSLLTFTEWYGATAEREEALKIGRKISYSFMDIFVGIIWFTPAILYRWSLKSTSVIYAPLLWVLQPLAPASTTPGQKLRLFVRSDMTRFAFVCSLLAAALFVLKILLMVRWGQFVEAVSSTAFGQIFNPYIEPSIVPIWQLAMAVNATLMIALFLYVRWHLLQREEGVETSPRVTAGICAWATVLRRWLSLYTIACTLYITAIEALHLQESWPRLGDKIVPWG